MNFLTQLGVLAVILMILVILIKSNQTLERIYMEGEIEKETIEIPSFHMPKIRFSKKENDDEEMEDEECLERAPETIPVEKTYDWSVEMLDERGRTFGRKSIPSYPFTIGRKADNDYVLDDLSVSSYHASLEQEGQNIQLVDSGSLNKIYTNGMVVTNVTLEDGTEVKLGNIRLRFLKEGMTNGSVSKRY